MHKSIQIIAATVLSLATAVTVQAQGQSQWPLVVTTEEGNRIFFDTASQVRLFDSGVKKNTFRTVTFSAEGKPLRGIRFQADCFKGTLAMLGVEKVDAQGSATRQIPVNSEDKIPTIPGKDTAGADIWQYACSQF